MVVQAVQFDGSTRLYFSVCGCNAFHVPFCIQTRPDCASAKFQLPGKKYEEHLKN